MGSLKFRSASWLNRIVILLLGDEIGQRWPRVMGCLLFAGGLIGILLQGTVIAQEKQDEIYSFAFDVTPTSKYLWRGQRLTDGWSLQTGGTLGIKGFSFNVWGNLDLEAVNEGDSLPVRENPDAPPGSSGDGLQGKFSEVDYTFSYAHAFKDVSVEAGTIFYTFPERSASLSSTTEIYGGVAFDKVFLAPSVTLYIDIDETGKAGDTGLYFLASAGHVFLTPWNRVPAIEMSGTISLVNEGFSGFYYGASESGLHDFSFTISAPIGLSEKWSLSPFISYSALLGDFRDYQFRPAPDVYRGTAGSPATYADSVYGGLSLSLSF